MVKARSTSKAIKLINITSLQSLISTQEHWILKQKKIYMQSGAINFTSFSNHIFCSFAAVNWLPVINCIQTTWWSDQQRLCLPCDANWCLLRGCVSPEWVVKCRLGGQSKFDQSVRELLYLTVGSNFQILQWLSFS